MRVLLTAKRAWRPQVGNNMKQMSRSMLQRSRAIPPSPLATSRRLSRTTQWPFGSAVTMAKDRRGRRRRPWRSCSRTDLQLTRASSTMDGPLRMPRRRSSWIQGERAKEGVRGSAADEWWDPNQVIVSLNAWNSYISQYIQNHCLVSHHAGLSLQTTRQTIIYLLLSVMYRIDSLLPLMSSCHHVIMLFSWRIHPSRFSGIPSSMSVWPSLIEA